MCTLASNECACWYISITRVHALGLFMQVDMHLVKYVLHCQLKIEYTFDVDAELNDTIILILFKMLEVM